jgi:hypothetical protein
MRTNLMDQTVGTAKCKHQSTTHSHTKPLIQVSRIEKKEAKELYSPNPMKDLTFGSVPSNFTLMVLTPYI